MSNKINDATNDVRSSGFSSKLGFILATTGSAVGIGNLWMFPYMLGTNGGAIFFVIFLVFTILFGLPLLIGEMTLGRASKKDVVDSYRTINKKWTFVGVIEVICPFIMMTFYSVVGGWILKYLFSYITATDFGTDKTLYFEMFCASSVEPVVWHIIFITLCVVLSSIGIEKGIEKANKIMLPALFVIIFILAIYCLTLPGASEGLKFLFVPDFSKLNSPLTVFYILLAAMGQAFFSLSLGQGAIINYGSYLRHNNNIQKDCSVVVFFNIFVAVMAGLVIVPACFTFNTSVAEGPGLIFGALPSVFSSMPFGNIVGALFFLLVFFAAFSSAIALFEVVCTFLVDRFKIKRTPAAIIVGVVLGALGALISLSMGPLSDFTLLGFNLFDFANFITAKLLIPLGVLLMALFVGYVWKMKNFFGELEKGSNKIHFQKTITVICKYVAPTILLVVLSVGIISQFVK